MVGAHLVLKFLQAMNGPHINLLEAFLVEVESRARAWSSHNECLEVQSRNRKKTGDQTGPDRKRRPGWSGLWFLRCRDRKKTGRH
ncbi:hypothetical protein GALMADRAFT_1320312 [Galerina marginata CBS 339.88]|uniref:Uncharacterized protein n=1 Tax=Galerina marginata (strain CBS 339.88) TaxID=685588 RepID=A0A067SC28_GALM3|nr:hypothetical protein GALMADRAFT_1320312 [Galerina marginata CBS 339.88]